MTAAGDTGIHPLPIAPTTAPTDPIIQPDADSARTGGPLLRAALRMALVLLLGVAVLRWLGDAVQILRDPNGGFDFISYYAAALALRDNPAANIYDLHTLQMAALAHHAAYPGTRYMYPPLLAVALMPLTWLPAGVALRIWAVFNLLLWLACLMLITRLLRSLLVAARPARVWRLDADTRLFLISIVAFLALTYDPVAAGIGLGQINVVICFLVLLALNLDRRGHPGPAGAVLALASLIKVYPLLILGYYLLRGRWRVLRGGMIALAVLLLGMFPVLGVQGLLMTSGFFAAGDTAVVLGHNEALLRAPIWLATLAGSQPGTAASVLGVALVALVSLAFVVGVLWAARIQTVPRDGAARGWDIRVRWRIASGSDGRGDVEGVFGYLWALCTMVLVAPVSWEHAYTWLLPALILGFGYALLAGAGSWRRTTLLLAILTLSYALTTADFPLGFDHTDQLAAGATVLGYPLRPIFMLARPLGAVLLWAAMGWLFLTACRAARGAIAAGAATKPQLRLTPRRLAVVLVGLLGTVVLVRGAIVAVIVLYGAAYSPTVLLR